MFDMQCRNYLNFILKEKIQFEELNFLTTILIINTRMCSWLLLLCWDVYQKMFMILIKNISVDQFILNGVWIRNGHDVIQNYKRCDWYFFWTICMCSIPTCFSTNGSFLSIFNKNKCEIKLSNKFLINKFIV